MIWRHPHSTLFPYTTLFRSTGDAGMLTDDGEIILTERIKDLYKTSNGKYIAPQMIETRISEDKYIDQDRKSTRLNSSHVRISYAVFCLKKKNNKIVILST